MKYAYATMIVLCLLASTSWSASNPMIRNCNLAGGEFTVVEMKDKKIRDQWALCKFDKSYVGALDVMLFNTKESIPTAIDEYTTGIYECSGQVRVAQVLHTTKEFLVCQYADNSIIDLNSLFLGFYSPENFQLNKFLGL